MPSTRAGALPLALGMLLLLSAARETVAQLYTQRDASGRLVVRNIPRPPGKRSSRGGSGKAPRLITGRVSYDPLVREAGARYGVDSELIHAVIWLAASSRRSRINPSRYLRIWTSIRRWYSRAMLTSSFWSILIPCSCGSGWR